MFIIYTELVKKYIENLSLSDLEKLAHYYHISYTKDELSVIYSFVKENYLELLNKNIIVFQKIKNRIHPVLYQQLFNLYMEYKQKYL